MGYRGCNQGHHHTNANNMCGCEKNKCFFRFKAPCVPEMNGVIPPPPINSSKVCEIYLATDESIANGQYLGLGTASALFPRNTVVIPENAIITGIVLNVRDNTLTAEDTVTAEVVISRSCGFTDPISTGVIATVTGPNTEETPNCCGSATASYPINKCDLLSVRIVTGDGALPFGAAVTVMYVLP